MSFKKTFVDGIRPLLAENGFLYENKDDAFVKHEEGLVKKIVLDTSAHEPRFTVLPKILIRQADVARIVEAVDGARFKGKWYFTIRTSQPGVAYLLGRPEYQIGLHVLKDDITVRAAITNFNSFMSDLGFSFYDRFKTLNDFDKWFNDDVLNGTHDFKRGDSGDNAKEALIVAKLNNNPRFHELCHLWIDGLEKAKKWDTYIEPLRSLKVYLDKH